MDTQTEIKKIQAELARKQALDEFIIAAIMEDYDFHPNTSNYALKKDVQGMVATKLGVMLSGRLCGQINRILFKHMIWNRTLDGASVYRGLKKRKTS